MTESINEKKDKKALLVQFIKFGIIGGINALINLVVYYTLVYFGAHYLIANFFGFALSVLNAYILNSKFVFNKTQEGHVVPLIKVYITYGTTFLLGSGLMYLMVSVIGITKWVAPIINIALMTPLNFVLNKVWALK